MAIVTRYFSTASAGGRDGTSWSDRARMFNSNIAVNSGTWSAAFTPGETATQTGTGATGIVELAGGSGTLLSLSGVTGSPNNSGVWTGGTSGSTVTPTATPISNAWSAVILRFAFNASDALDCLVEGGLTYTCGQEMIPALFSPSAPSTANRLKISGCNSSGVKLQPANINWMAVAENIDDSAYPVFSITTAVGFLQLVSVDTYCIKLSTTHSNYDAILNGGYNDWISITSSSANAYIAVGSAIALRNSQILTTGTGISHLSLNHGIWINCRIMHTGANPTTQNCITVSSAVAGEFVTRMERCLISRYGVGIISDTATSRSASIDKCVIVGCGSHGLQLQQTSVGSRSEAINSFIANNGGNGIFCSTGFSPVYIRNCRLRNNTSGNITGIHPHYSESDVYTDAGTDADEFVNAAGGDYRIKNTSLYWGLGIGGGDEPAAGGGGARIPNIRGGADQ